ncbi:MAG: hypothetical protein LBC97_08940 [Bifidobacteriaceae bacterium]|jgi:hypothetical protein|nr:hypothetical protein [Bifidobacteriaceae bacterium]
MTQPRDPSWDRFADPDYLRSALLRIHQSDDGWRTDPEADELIRYAADRFAGLARKHGLEETDAMSVAFEAMRNPATRYGAADPWGVIVHAVATTFRAWQFAEEALCSVDTARRGGLSGCRAERMCERDQVPLDCDPAFTQADPEAPGGWDGPTVYQQARHVAGLLARNGWPFDSALLAVEVVLRKLADSGSRPSAYEALRRDRRWRCAAGIPAASWTGLLRLLLGAPSEAAAMTSTGKGLLLRLALDEDVETDPAVAAAIALIAPGGGRA